VVNIRRAPAPTISPAFPSASSATSALSGFDFDLVFSQRLRASAVNIWPRFGGTIETSWPAHPLKRSTSGALWDYGT
jgi:hypothetical protein